MDKTLLWATTLIAAGLANASELPHWTYAGEAGPQHWGELSPDFAVCRSGKNQSPVNLTGMIDGSLPPLQVEYRRGGNEILNNGHTVQVNYAPGSVIEVGGGRYELKQFHFHAPSENTIEGRSYPLEAHFVHADADGNLAVVAVMFEEGEANGELEKAWSQLPEHSGDRHSLAAAVDAASILPAAHDYYRFNGSLTTPPCSEGVLWLVEKQVQSASKAQIARLAEAIHHPNNRPLQALNARAVLR